MNTCTFSPDFPISSQRALRPRRGQECFKMSQESTWVRREFFCRGPGLRRWKASHLFLSFFGLSPRHKEMSHDSVCGHSSPLSRLLPCPGYYKQCCDEHWGTRVSVPSGFLSVYAQQWDCWIIRQFYFHVHVYVGVLAHKTHKNRSWTEFG